MKFSSMGIQMGVTIGGAAWFGNWLDSKGTNEKPVWTIVFSLLGIAVALYMVIKEAGKLSDDNEN